MTREEAEKYAENMTYREALYNLKQGKSVPYRKATFIKVNELLNELEQKSVIHAKWERYYTRPHVYADLFWHCSNCNFKTASVNADKYYKYCPSCGARMDKE